MIKRVRMTFWIQNQHLLTKTVHDSTFEGSCFTKMELSRVVEGARGRVTAENHCPRDVRRAGTVCSDPRGSH